MLPDHIYHFSGDKPGPCVVVMGTVHGDESIGVDVIEDLRNSLKNEKIHGDVYLILGNPKAFEAGKRYMEDDLNRLFGKDFSDLEEKDPASLNYEEKRALEITPILQKADYLLDIHSTLVPSPTFIYTEYKEENLNLACLFATEFIVSADHDFRPEDLISSIDNFVDRHGGIGITYETGWCKDPQAKNNAIKNTKSLLRTLGLAFFDMEPLSGKTSQHIVLYDAIIPESTKFVYGEKYDNFHFFEEGAYIAADGDAEIIAERDSYLVFPSQHLKDKNIAGYLGYSVGHVSND